MEMLEGEALSEQLRRGPLTVPQAVSVGLEILSALSALHARAIIHRDLKPSNVFVTPHGVKLLDFGLARPELGGALSPDTDVTQTGMIMGTPRYMAPEAVKGETVDARSDLFATGAILFEMLAGRPAFDGRTIADVIHATVYEQPPALSGSSIVAAIDRVIRQALAKRPSDRLPSAEVMAEELRWAGGVETEADDRAGARADTSRRAAVPHSQTRRRDRLSRLQPARRDHDVALRHRIADRPLERGGRALSPATRRISRHSPRDANVDRVVMGTLLRSGDQLRAVAQLVEAPGGTVLTSHTVQAPLGDLFRLQDDIAARVVEALSLPLTGVPPHTPDTPHNAQCLRALPPRERAGAHLRRRRTGTRSVRAVSRSRSGVRAGVGASRTLSSRHREVHRRLVRSRRARRRPSIGRSRSTRGSRWRTSTYAQLEADMGQSTSAMVRLLGQAAQHGNDPELFAGLVHACRYCGLFEQAIDAHAEARRLDPNVPTSIEQTIMLSGDLDRLLSLERRAFNPGGGDYGIRVIGLGLAGRRDEAREVLGTMDADGAHSDVSHLDVVSPRVARSPHPRHARQSATALSSLKVMDDPEAIFQEGLAAVRRRRVRAWTRASCAEPSTRATTWRPVLEGRPQFDAIRQRAGIPGHSRDGAGRPRRRTGRVP